LQGKVVRMELKVLDAEEESLLTGALKWAAGVDVDLPPDWKPPVPTLLRLLWLHRLSHRFSGRVKKGRPQWCSRECSIAVWQQCRVADKHVQHQLQFLKKVSCAHHSDQPFIIVKGFSPYALTGDPTCLYASGDIDIFAPDPEHLRQTLEAMGLQAKEELGPHEYAALYSGSLEVEIHNFFSVYSYPSGIEAVNLFPHQNPGVWRQSLLNLQETQITYQEIAKHRVEGGQAPDTQGLFFPDAAMAVFLNCTHIFRNYTGASLYGDLDIRLGDLLNIRDLCELPAFNRQSLAALTDQFNGSDCVALVGSLLTQLFGEHPFSNISSRLNIHSEILFPRQLLWYSFWAIVDEDISDTLLPSRKGWSLLDRIGATHVTASGDGSSMRYAVSAPGYGEQVDRVLVQTHASRPGVEIARELSFFFSAMTNAEGIVIEISLVAPLPDYHYGVGVFIPMSLPSAAHKKICSQGQSRSDASEEGELLVYRFVFNWADVRSISDKRVLPAVISISSLHKDVASVVPGTYLSTTVPVKIVYAEPQKEQPTGLA